METGIIVFIYLRVNCEAFGTTRVSRGSSSCVVKAAQGKRDPDQVFFKAVRALHGVALFMRYSSTPTYAR